MPKQEPTTRTPAEALCDGMELVDQRLVPLTRPLGSLVILFAQAEAELLALVTALRGGNEDDAAHLLKTDRKLEQVRSLCETAGLADHVRCELIEHLDAFKADREKRNRFIHDEWAVYVYPERAPMAVPSTRGRPHAKGSGVVWDEPKPEEVWDLALRVREHKTMFSGAAWRLTSSSA